MSRLGIASLDPAVLASVLACGYSDAGFERLDVRPIEADALSRWPSTWARRLSFGGERSFVRTDAHASRDEGAPRPVG